MPCHVDVGQRCRTSPKESSGSQGIVVLSSHFGCYFLKTTLRQSYHAPTGHHDACKWGPYGGNVQGSPRSSPHCPTPYERRASSATLRRSGVNGTCRRRAPVASKIALPSAAATSVMTVSPAPAAGTSVRLSTTLSIRGTSNPSGRLR